jgi:hypothetical protein
MKVCDARTIVVGVFMELLHNLFRTLTLMVALFTIQHLSVGVISALFSRAGACEKVHKDDVFSLLQRLVVFPLLMMSERKLEMMIWRWKSELLAERFDAIV